MNPWQTALMAATLALLLAPAGHAQPPDPVWGTWNLNLAKSKYDPGPAPKTLTVTVNLTNAKGEPVHDVSVYDRQ